MPQNANLYALFANRFATRSDALALESFDGRCYTYGELDQMSARIAAALAQAGARPGDRVAAQVEKSALALALYLGCLRGGFVYLPLNTAYRARELDYFISDAEPAVIVCRPQAQALVAELAGVHGGAQVLTLDAQGEGSLTRACEDVLPEERIAERAPDALAAILYTSGTTGRPKGAMLSHANLAANATVLHEAWGFAPDDVLLHTLPLFHTHGLFVACHTSLLNATPMLFCPKFDVATCMRLLPRATVFMGVPTFYVRLLEAPDFGRRQCEHMRLFVSGSAPLLAQTFHEFEARTGHAILERYGMTECGMSTSNPLAGERRAGTVGPPLPGVALRVVDEQDKPLASGEVGRIEFTGPNVFRGYWRAPEKSAQEFTADGYFKSGDLGRIDADGYVSIVGRDRDLIISGGYNVYPKEVELCIDAIEGVAESAVIGLAHRDFGEQVAAVVILAATVRLSEQEIIAALDSQLANYKLPKRVFFVDALPRNAMGKVQKNTLRERFNRV